MQFIGQEWLCWDRPLNFLEVSATPSTPFADKLKLYAKDKAGVSNLYFLDDAGVEHDLAPSIIGGSGAAGQVAYWTAVSTLSGEAALQYDDANDRFGVGGTAAPDFPLHLSIDNAGSTVQPVIDKFGANAGPLLTGRAAKGSRASPTQMVVNDLLFGIAGQGRHNGGAWSSNNPAAIRFKAAETFTTIAQGAYISLETTPVGSTTPAERFRVGPSGELGIGGATYGGSGDIFSSGGASSPPSWVTRATLNAALDHGLLAGLLDDDHTEYALLAGRSGGQTLKGGIAASETLTLASTAHATKGKILFGSSAYDEVNNRLGIGTTNPTTPLHVVGNSLLAGLVAVGGTAINANTLLMVGANLTDPTATSFGMKMSRTILLTSDNAQNVTGAYGNLSLTTGVHNLTGDIRGSHGEIEYSGTGIVSIATGAGAKVFNVSSGTITEGAAFYAEIWNLNAAGVITNAYGLKVPNILLQLGTLVNTYGVYVGDMSVGTQTNTPFSFYASDPNALNYFAGDILIGTTLPPSAGTNGLIFGDGTALSGMASNTAGMYADDIAGNVSMHAINENGDVIKLIKTGTYTPTNVGADRSYDADSTTVDELADVLGTLIADLQLTGLLG